MNESRDVAAADGLLLRRRGDGALELRANGVFVMDTVETSSEQVLAARALELHERPDRVLVGGLGLGFTLEAVLIDPRVRRCTVAEIEPALVGWMRDGTVPHGPGLLHDARVEVYAGDVADLLRAGSVYDVVLLDVDNGPGNLVHQTNAGLYDARGLAAARAALAPGGMLVIWSGNRAPTLLEEMRTSFGDAEEIRCPVTLQGRSTAYWIYAARVPSFL